MLLKRLVFDNYKTYYGHQEINLYIPEEVRTDVKKNIVLIGGLNGAGKTTILKAILYVLFGKRGISESEYTKLFSNVINNTFFDEGGRDCSVTLIIETDSKEEWELKVSWSFDNYKRVIQENRDISIRKPGTNHGKQVKIQNIEAYNRLIDRVIPYHAAPFFIFDGEEIKEIILRQNSQEMKEAIHKITGMETYKIFLNDLKDIEMQLQQTLAKASNNKKLESIQNAVEQENQKIEEYKKKLSDLQSNKQSLKEEATSIKKSRDEKLLFNRKSRDKLVEEKTRLDIQHKQLLEQFKNTFANNAVSIILESKIEKLIEKIKLEKKLRDKRLMLESSLTPYKTFITELLESNINPPLTEEQIRQIRLLGKEIWIKENNLQNIDQDIEEIHDLSPRDYDTLISQKPSNTNELVKLLNQIDQYEQHKSNLETQINTAPEAVNVEKENILLDELHKKLGEIELRERSLKIKLRNSMDEKKRLDNQFSRLSDQVRDVGDIERKYFIVKNLIISMEEFIEQSTTMKAHFIKEEFSSILQKLFRKQDEFGKIDFDINTYTIKLFNDRGQEISIHDRSAGEMQMISSSLIWALTKASDLSLPMVIDTPLGRLDSIHRRHLIDYYYKALSEQVIILSTDTEVTDEYIQMMSENSHRQYMLDYNEKKKYTVIRDGYFEFIRGVDNG